ncbi:2-nitropropane dioxygenase [Heterostelium album PN500]|uniref:2-nitropropane dioxygenase n=1 Tax=Heterostelium pallidum (strain ATCC 26659 / Pp 5 / PN500) TaxID=670386 RepID=D3BCV9_HETP5|nr:2-nitropropane dioxygenase [Heterostelium album PN500]EFA80751.1 2-nitropropane dioxygenase [Heterostelium album PN500]|eukprot:XP_020432871.1 2-nitropropane dioxygenase [Heterostelium album PN500]
MSHNYLKLLKYPIIQAPLSGGTTNPKMVLEVLKQGCMGSHGCAYLSLDQLRSDCKEIVNGVKQQQQQQQHLNVPFNINLFAPSLPSDCLPGTEHWRTVVEPKVKRMNDYLNSHFRTELGLPHRTIESFVIPDDNQRFQQQCQVVLEELGQFSGPKVLSFTFGIPDTAVLQRFRDAGFMLTLDLLRQCRDAGIKLPLIGAGGIHNREDIDTMLRSGASAVQIGTAFINSLESTSNVNYKKVIEMSNGGISKGDGDGDSIVYTKAFTGRYARGIKNRFVEKIESEFKPDEIPPFPIQHILTTDIRKKALEDGRTEYTHLWIGESASLSKNRNNNNNNNEQHILVNFPNVLLSEIISHLKNIDRICWSLVCKRWYNQKDRYLLFDTDRITSKAHLDHFKPQYRMVMSRSLELKNDCSVLFSMKTSQTSGFDYYIDYGNYFLYKTFMIDINGWMLTYSLLLLLLSIGTLKDIDKIYTNVTSIRFYKSYDLRELKVGSLPPNLTVLKFSGYSQAIEAGVLPQSLVRLESAPITWIPAIKTLASLKTLSFYTRFGSETVDNLIKLDELPPSLTDLSFKSTYQLRSAIPTAIRYLDIGSCQYDMQELFPSGSRPNYRFEMLAIAKQIQSYSSLQDIKVRALKLYNMDRARSIELIQFPVGLECLDFSYFSAGPITAGAIPKSIRKLTLASDRVKFAIFEWSSTLETVHKSMIYKFT